MAPTSPIANFFFFLFLDGNELTLPGKTDSQQNIPARSGKGGVHAGLIGSSVHICYRYK